MNYYFAPANGSPTIYKSWKDAVKSHKLNIAGEFGVLIQTDADFVSIYPHILFIEVYNSEITEFLGFYYEDKEIFNKITPDIVHRYYGIPIFSFIPNKTSKSRLINVSFNQICVKLIKTIEKYDFIMKINPIGFTEDMEYQIVMKRLGDLVNEEES